MKKIFLMMAFAGLMLSISAQGDKKEAPKAETKTALKDHVCSAKCTKTTHVYAHGEKGHVCGDRCAAAAATKK